MREDIIIRATFFACLVVAVIGTFFTAKHASRLGARRFAVTLLPYVYPVVIVIWGLFLPWGGREDTEPAWRMQVTSLLALLLYPGLCLFSLWRSRGARLFVVVHIPLSLFISFFATLWTVAYISGD